MNFSIVMYASFASQNIARSCQFLLESLKAHLFAPHIFNASDDIECFTRTEQSRDRRILLFTPLVVDMFLCTQESRYVRF